ncbi:MAG: GAF and ANTAR domain-containing protein [Actinobacteria bacterium]|nr:GAF and ANTAR domain-containing protein [Actinomycetota bacterium]
MSRKDEGRVSGSTSLGAPKGDLTPDDHLKRQIEALQEVSRAIVSDLYLEDILKLIVMVTAEVMDSNICSLLLLNEKEGTLEIRATQSVSDDYLNKPPIRLGEGIAGMVAAENRPMQVRDVKTEPLYASKSVAEKEGLCSLLCVPMCVKGRVIGVLNCYTSQPREFTPQDVSLLTAVANQAAVAIENTELLVKTRIIQEELETRKLVERAKDLLARNLGVSGEEAYRRMQRKSMNTRKSMREIAEAVILADVGED